MRSAGPVWPAAVLLVAGGCGGGAGNAPGAPPAPPLGRVLISVADPNWFLSPFNWYRNGAAYAESTDPGAYFTLGFTGTSAALLLDLVPLASVPPPSWPVLRWQVDGAAVQSSRPGSLAAQMPLATGLAAGAHMLTLWFVSCGPQADRWILPAQCVRVTGLVLDARASSVAPQVRPRRYVFFGDSITQGVGTEGASGVSLADDDATAAFPYACAAVLNAEFGVVGVEGQGWLEPAPFGVNVPALTQAWPYYFNRHLRGQFPAADGIVVMEGENDPPGYNLAGLVATWLASVRSVAPTTPLYVVVPFGGSHRADIAAGVAEYQALYPSDRQARLIDLGPAAGTGLAGPLGTPTPESFDGIHPNAATSRSLGIEVAAAINAASR